MSDEKTRTFNATIGKAKQQGLQELFFYTIPLGFRDNLELLAYWKKRLSS